MAATNHEAKRRVPGIGLKRWSAPCMGCGQQEPDSLVEFDDGTIWCRRCGLVFDPVAPEDGCPNCGERNSDALIWIDDDRVRCERCHTIYRPGKDQRDGKA